eukprot:scaffold1220_cov259-Pinguiococcus_pyrenoidosus.AAC.51
MKGSPRLFVTVQSVLSAFESSQLYRELKLRGSVVRDGKLVLLPQEELINTWEGVWNLSSDQGNLGVFFVTNVRVVWHASLAQNFNVSVPYMQMKAVRVRNSKFGKAFVIETTSRGGNYVLGFRLESEEVLDEVFKEIQSLYGVYSVTPIFGVEYRVEDPSKEAESAMPELVEDVEIVEPEISVSDGLAVHYAIGKHRPSDGGIVLDPFLGLAVESIPGGLSTKDLWSIV